MYQVFAYLSELGHDCLERVTERASQLS
jgi:hypothetical protein